MTNALKRCTSTGHFQAIWRAERNRLRRSSYGVDRISGRKFEERLSYEILQLQQRSLGKFRPSGLLAISKPKPGGGNRILCVPTIADRLLQLSLLVDLRPTLAKRGLLNTISYGLMRNARRGVADARRRALELRAAHRWVYKADIRRFFDNIPRTQMKAVARTIIPQRSFHPIVSAFVDCEITDGFDPDWPDIVIRAGIVPGLGVRQGMPLSPYFAGMLLRDLDRTLATQKIPAIRYVDDIMAFFDNRQQCYDFHHYLSERLDTLGLKIGHPDRSGSKSAIYEPKQAAEFLGMEITPAPSGDYCLMVSDACIQKIGAKFCQVASLDHLLTKQLTLTRLGGYLDAIERGYVRAYDGAENHGKLRRELVQMKEAAITYVLENLFGERLPNLSKQQRTFIGL